MAHVKAGLDVYMELPDAVFEDSGWISSASFATPEESAY